MKRIFTLFSCIFIAGMLQAQSPGSKGQLLPNVAPEAQDAQPRTKGTNGYGPAPSYVWNFMYSGYSEVFLRIPEPGLHTVMIGDQSITAPNGRFRFFDLAPGQQHVAVFRNGILLYKALIPLQNNRRYVLDYFSGYGLYLLQTENLNNGFGGASYGDIWNQMWGNIYQGGAYGGYNPYGGYNNQYPGSGYYNGGGYGNPYPPQGGINGGYYGPGIMDPGSFQLFKQSVASRSFDNGKLDAIKAQSNQSGFTAMQVKELLDLFSFDNKKLEAAKLCYAKCPDKQNYFVTHTSFSFDSYVKDLNAYTSSH